MSNPDNDSSHITLVALELNQKCRRSDNNYDNNTDNFDNDPWPGADLPPGHLLPLGAIDATQHYPSEGWTEGQGGSEDH